MWNFYCYNGIALLYRFYVLNKSLGCLEQLVMILSGLRLFLTKQFMNVADT